MMMQGFRQPMKLMENFEIFEILFINKGHGFS